MSNPSDKIIYYTETTPHINKGKNKANTESNLSLDLNTPIQETDLNSDVAVRKINDMSHSKALQLQPPNAVEEQHEYTCAYCSKVFASKQAFGGHQNAHKLERSLEKAPKLARPGMNQDASFIAPLGVTINDSSYTKPIDSTVNDRSHIYPIGAMVNDRSYFDPIGSKVNDRSYVGSIAAMFNNSSYVDPFYQFPMVLNKPTPNLNQWMMGASAPYLQIQHQEPQSSASCGSMKPPLPETVASQVPKPIANVFRSPSPGAKSPRFAPYHSRPEKGKTVSKDTNTVSSAWNDQPGEKPEAEDGGLDLTLRL